MSLGQLSPAKCALTAYSYFRYRKMFWDLDNAHIDLKGTLSVSIHICISTRLPSSPGFSISFNPI
jgi:hypothetical protein